MTYKMLKMEGGKLLKLENTLVKNTRKAFHTKLSKISLSHFNGSIYN